jgi:hypothetical protein
MLESAWACELRALTSLFLPPPLPQPPSFLLYVCRYATSRYTTGTPHFLVNGLPVDDQIPDGTAAEWYAMIDPLLAGSRSEM